MAARELIRIDEERCDGCGECVPACAEGAIAIVDGKARLVSETFCDGLGACLGHCPQGAITIEKVEAAPFDAEAVERAKATGSRQQATVPPPTPQDEVALPSALRQWPIQLHLVSPAAPHYRGVDVLLAADCVAFALGDFHRAYLAGRALAIACPKLDTRQEVYLDKLTALIDRSEIASLTVMVMQVPCCSGLVQLAAQAAMNAGRAVAIRYVVVGIEGGILDEGPVPLRPRTSFPSSLPVRS